jgi:hypothetical protein
MPGVGPDGAVAKLPSSIAYAAKALDNCCCRRAALAGPAAAGAAPDDPACLLLPSCAGVLLSLNKGWMSRSTPWSPCVCCRLSVPAVVQVRHSLRFLKLACNQLAVSCLLRHSSSSCHQRVFLFAPEQSVVRRTCCCWLIIRAVVGDVRKGERGGRIIAGCLRMLLLLSHRRGLHSSDCQYCIVYPTWEPFCVRLETGTMVGTAGQIRCVIDNLCCIKCLIAGRGALGGGAPQGCRRQQLECQTAWCTLVIKPCMTALSGRVARVNECDQAFQDCLLCS